MFSKSQTRYNWAEWHADIYEKVSAGLEQGGELECECVGGGRILHEPVHETIEVYGYSQVRRSRYFYSCLNVNAQ